MRCHGHQPIRAMEGLHAGQCLRTARPTHHRKAERGQHTRRSTAQFANAQNTDAPFRRAGRRQLQPFLALLQGAVFRILPMKAEHIQQHPFRHGAGQQHILQPRHGDARRRPRCAQQMINASAHGNNQLQVWITAEFHHVMRGPNHRGFNFGGVARIGKQPNFQAGINGQKRRLPILHRMRLG